MALYQADILEEEVVRQWGTHVSKKYVDKDKSKKVRKSADAFLKVSTFRICPVFLAELTSTVARRGRGVFGGGGR